MTAGKPATEMMALASDVFKSSSHLLAATFERLPPQVTASAPTSGTLRQQLIELLSRQAALFDDVLLQSGRARGELDDFDVELALCQLVGPLALARMTGLRTMTHHD